MHTGNPKALTSKRALAVQGDSRLGGHCRTGADRFGQVDGRGRQPARRVPEPARGRCRAGGGKIDAFATTAIRSRTAADGNPALEAVANDLRADARSASGGLAPAHLHAARRRPAGASVQHRSRRYSDRGRARRTATPIRAAVPAHSAAAGGRWGGAGAHPGMQAGPPGRAGHVVNVGPLWVVLAMPDAAAVLDLRPDVAR